MRDGHTSGTYTAFVFCVYAFLSIIALVTVLNIVNSISMSVSARMKQYGAMRAVGMDEWQVTKMIAAEATTYAVWHFPMRSLCIILLFVLLAAIFAFLIPAKRIHSMQITETINEL